MLFLPVAVIQRGGHFDHYVGHDKKSLRARARGGGGGVIRVAATYDERQPDESAPPTRLAQRSALNTSHPQTHTEHICVLHFWAPTF